MFQRVDVQREGSPAASPDHDVRLHVVAPDGKSEAVAEAEDKENESEHHLQRQRSLKTHQGLTSKEAEELLEKYGRNELASNDIPKWKMFLLQFTGPMPCLLWIAIIIEGAIEDWADFGVLLFIQFFNGTLAFYELSKAGDAVAALKESISPKATVRRDGKWVEKFDAALLVPGDVVMLGSGAAVPADCKICDGNSLGVNQSALTGESLPVTIRNDEMCKWGSTVETGEAVCLVVATGKDTFFGQTAALLTGPAEVSNLQKLLRKVMGVLVLLSFLVCIVIFIVIIINEDIKSTISFVVVVLVASIPFAMDVVVTSTLAMGSKSLANEGAIVTRLSAIEDLAGLNCLCSDKTGTLTKNKMELTGGNEVPDGNIKTDGSPVIAYTQKQVLEFAALAAKWMEPPRDALDRLVLGGVDLSSLESATQTAYMPFDPKTKRTEGTVMYPLIQPEPFKVTKGAPHVIFGLLTQEDFVRASEEKVEALGAQGIRVLAVARTDTIDGPWYLVGLLAFLDPPRVDSAQTITNLNKAGVAVKMITGDHLLIAKETARRLGMQTNILNSRTLPDTEAGKDVPQEVIEEIGPTLIASAGFAQVFPQHKHLIVTGLKRLGYKIGMTGDGVNDAPAIKAADVGIAVAGATDAARAASDIVLTQEGLSTIGTALITARSIFSRIRAFLWYRMAATIQLIIFFFVATIFLRPPNYFDEIDPEITATWPEQEITNWNSQIYFEIPVLMLILITLLNDGTLITIGYDNQKPSSNPEYWNIPLLWLMATVLGGIPCVASCLLVHAALGCWNPEGAWQKNFGLQPIFYGHIIALMYLQLSISAFLTLLSARTRADPLFTKPYPSPLVLFGAVFALLASTLIAMYWPTSYYNGVPIQGLKIFTNSESQPLAGGCWLYCVLWWVIQDVGKIFTGWLVEKMQCRCLMPKSLPSLFPEKDREMQPLPPSMQKKLDEMAKKAEHMKPSLPQRAPASFGYHPNGFVCSMLKDDDQTVLSRVSQRDVFKAVGRGRSTAW
eukprot:g70085.t1